ncbi:tyrosine-type recombinase/integrase [Oceanisphaera sp. IT1-181]|uniref:tyrosine-type recombinase/integrase n=1 Tax=Oceanisphaera sp. IT1-181 TaxID=3081199 RepID=UPI0029C9C4B8|nr:tyrosine-type recombinase/integrase [Oceanisphaera sp. IT1-181]
METADFESKIGIIDETFLLCLSAVKGQVSTLHLRYLKQMFNSNPFSPIFARGLHRDDFPTHRPKKGRNGEATDRILSKAMNRAAVAYTLDCLDTAYAEGKIDIGHYSFVNLAFSVFARNESYRQITLSDLKFDETHQQYFIDIVTAKTRQYIPNKARYKLSDTVGLLLVKQRQHVIEKYSYLVAEGDTEKMALFPARQLNKDGSWRHTYAIENFGMYRGAVQFGQGYGAAIAKKLGGRITLGNFTLRHTLGTLLAQTGASAKTIQAVLKHATDTTCKHYVDIAFHGLMFELSEAMQPAFTEHLPTFLNFRSKSDSVIIEKRITTEDTKSNQWEDVGECGKEIVCENAPIVCYSCFRFNPCWDADHGINLRFVEQEIEYMSKLGKPFQHMVERAKIAKNHIVVVMNAIDRYREVMNTGEQT